MMLILWLSLQLVFALSADPDRYHRNTQQTRHDDFQSRATDEEKSASYWNTLAQNTLKTKLQQEYNTGVAKNVIMFLGDGMGITTQFAARVYKGQLKGEPGENESLSFENFPFSGLAKTYSIDKQVTDSAATATAYLCGVKTNMDVLGVTGAVEVSDCDAMNNIENHVYSIARWAQLSGKRTGFVTTTRVTHASPAGLYSHTAHRDWESDKDVVDDGYNSSVCIDIASQLVHGETGSNFYVILGGGRRAFIPNTAVDEEGNAGRRYDGRNLIEEWQNSKEGENFQYVWNRDQLLQVSSDTDYLLGLFESDHCLYNIELNQTTDPSLTEMTEAAVKILSKGSNGFFLFVEGGRIDHAHHDTLTKKSLDDTVEFSNAVERTLDLVDVDETLIVVTADHSHAVSISGYPDRGNRILGIAGTGDDNLPYATISYANGPEYYLESNGSRHNLHEDDMEDDNYAFPKMVPRDSETHGGEDVGVYAIGPWAHLFTGVYEQNVIPHIMAYSACIGEGEIACHTSHGNRIQFSMAVTLISLFCIIYPMKG